MSDTMTILFALTGSVFGVVFMAMGVAVCDMADHDANLTTRQYIGKVFAGCWLAIWGVIVLVASLAGAFA